MSAILSRMVGALALTLSLGSANAQVSPGTPSAATQPTFPSGRGPVIAIDEAHKNTHTFGSPPFRGLVQLLQADGYRVRPMTETVSESSLVEVDVLLISQPGGWFGPDESLKEQEVSRLLEWVREGGSLLLVLVTCPRLGMPPVSRGRSASLTGRTATQWRRLLIRLRSAQSFSGAVIPFLKSRAELAPQAPAEVLVIRAAMRCWHTT